MDVAEAGLAHAKDYRHASRSFIMNPREIPL